MELFNEGVTCPLRVRSIEESLHKGEAIFVYTLTPSQAQGKLMRDTLGMDNEDTSIDAVNLHTLTFASRHRIPDCGVGDYFTWNLMPFTKFAHPVEEPGMSDTAILQLIKALFPGSEGLTSLLMREDPEPVEPVEEEYRSPSEDEAAFTRRYITQNYAKGEWQRMNHIQRGEALGKARFAYMDANQPLVPVPDPEPATEEEVASSRANHPSNKPRLVK